MDTTGNRQFASDDKLHAIILNICPSDTSQVMRWTAHWACQYLYFQMTGRLKINQVQEKLSRFHSIRQVSAASKV